MCQRALILLATYPVAPSESDSDENIEDLLSEYQHYLDKAHKQKKIYEEKFKNLKYIHRPEPYGKTSYKNNHNEKEKTITEEKQFINLPLLSPRTNYDLMKSPCICKDNQIPCDCNCKQCLMPIETTGNDNFDQSKHVDFADNKAIFSPMAFNNDNIFENSGFSNRPTTADNDLNIRIKVDIQLPRILESLLKQKNRSQDKELENDEKNSKETRFLFHSPVSKLNFPIPIEIFGLKKPIRLNKHDSTSMHKITIHKKKKSKLNNNDSVATMETVMDLPSNLALEIVDILQDKMLASKVIKFDAAGMVIEESMPSHTFNPMKRHTNLVDIRKLFQMYFEQVYGEPLPDKKLKILTRCINHDTVCRFLSCPDISTFPRAYLGGDRGIPGPSVYKTQVGLCKHLFPQKRRVLPVVMLISNKFVYFFILCAIGTSLSSPTAYVSEGRGIGSTLWGWITYPFTWWSSSSTENEVETTTSVFTHDNNIEIAKHNVTVWCNDQTCTTMKCDKHGCNNITCNIYDTDMSGVCREYTIKPEEIPTSKPITQVTEEQKTTVATTVETSSLPSVTNAGVEERPLELEAVLSSTVPIDGEEKVEDQS
ncbi:hypothetical protein RR46_11316 [Papilio xuthus]|uniref:Uncharacterized protein n=1 Tax=Papilio xuthus TaxID=66420 RepID=A0A194PRM5_PAPXU|nr:hypothetical protein RR46_11316 [Papilio xuthus]